MFFLPAWSTLQISNFTLHTNPFSSQYVSMTLHMCQSSLMVFASCKITISPTFKFLLVFLHFFLSWSDCKNSFIQQHQNSFTMCWTCLHLLQLYKSAFEKSLGGCKIIFHFIVKRFDGERGKLLFGSLMLSAFKGREFKIPCCCHLHCKWFLIKWPAMCLHQRRKDRTSWMDLTFPNTTYMTGIRRIPFPSNRITTWCLHKRLKFLLVYFLSSLTHSQNQWNYCHYLRRLFLYSLF